MRPNSRLNWLDIAKGIAIILMVVGHTSIPKSVSNFIWAFHMPLFFIASGWTTNWSKYNIPIFFIHKLRNLILPFTVYSFVVLLVNKILDVGLDFSIIMGWGGYAMWFIPVLFVASILARFIYSINFLFIRYLFVIILLLIGCGLCHFHIHMPWSMSSVPLATCLIVVGSELKLMNNYVVKPLVVVIIALFVVTLVISHYCRLDMCYNSIMPIIPLGIAAVSGTIMMFMISSFIENHFGSLSKFFVVIGRETFVIVAFSQITIMLINQHFQLNAVVKYLILTVVLVALKYIKDKINLMCNTKIL